MVHFVGAGPGAPDLITLRGAEYLKAADVVIYAGSLVNPRLLENCRGDCDVYNSARMNLDEVLSVMEKAEAAGKTTVRLHTGDPSLYGAVREQMDALSEKGIAWDVTPGVSSLFGAAGACTARHIHGTVSLRRDAGSGTDRTACGRISCGNSGSAGLQGNMAG